MKISAATQFPASVDDVFQMLSNQDFQNTKCVESGAVSHTVEIHNADGDTVIAITRHMPTDDLPANVRGFVGDSIEIVEKEVWSAPDANGVRQGRVQASIAKPPISITGTVTLTPSAQGCEQHVDSDLTSGIPMIGRMVEQAAAPMIRESIDHEAKVAHEWLARHA